LQDEHKEYLINFFNECFGARVKDAIDNLTLNFKGFNLKEITVGKFISEDCNLSIKRIIRHPIARNDETRIQIRLD
jgi:hypothetical protein